VVPVRAPQRGALFEGPRRRPTSASTLFSIMTTEPNGGRRADPREGHARHADDAGRCRTMGCGVSVADALKMPEAGAGRRDCGAACAEESGLTPSIELAAGQLTAAARYRAPLRLREALDGIRMTLRLLTLVQTIIVHSEFLGRLDQAEVSL
jgi:hypothetical protein